MKYEKLELEDFPPNQKLRMLQNAVSDATELAYVKQIGDQDIARGNTPLAYDGYMELLLSACSTYDKNITPQVNRSVLCMQPQPPTIMMIVLSPIPVMGSTRLTK
jgi:hypothetical protein